MSDRPLHVGDRVYHIAIPDRYGTVTSIDLQFEEAMVDWPEWADAPHAHMDHPLQNLRLAIPIARTHQENT